MLNVVILSVVCGNALHIGVPNVAIPDLVTAINFTLPSVLTFKCDTEYTKYLKETNKTFVIYQINPNWITINKIFLNLTEHKQILAKEWKTTIELFVISFNLSLFPILYCILRYLFTNIQFKFSSMGSVFTINYDENDKPITKRIITIKMESLPYHLYLFNSLSPKLIRQNVVEPNSQITSKK